MTQRALVLFAHGARDSRWAAPFERLQQILQAKLPDVTVALAFLELMSPQLPELAGRLAQAGCDDVTVVPVFFGQGGHVLRDLPLLAEQLRQAHPQLSLRIAGAVGEDPAVLNAIALYCVESLTRA
ncbi:MAG: cobalamin biosynthesis protein CbiX [Noviherbaspirillum sp.]|nr:cobalamin biosynthesis protein CbiX [Noviherbaspirillum sp.]